MRVRFGWPGAAYGLVTVLLAVGALNSQNNLLFLAFGLAVSAGVISLVLGTLMMNGASVERSVPALATVGSPVMIRYVVRNRRRFLPLFALRITEADLTRRTGGISRWSEHLPSPHAAALHVGAGLSVEAGAVVIPTRRGIARFTDILLSSTFPFGLFRLEARFTRQGTMPIAPRPERLKRGVASNLLTHADAGITSTILQGRGDEFYGLREYVPGDSPRHISWRSTARTGSLIVREHTRPATGVLWVILNINSTPTGVAPDPAGPEERAIVLAASLIAAAASGEVDVGLVVLGAGILLPPGSAARRPGALLHALAEIDLVHPARRGREPDWHDRTQQRAACIVIHSGGIDPAAGPPGARHLTADDLPRLIASPASGCRHTGGVA